MLGQRSCASGNVPKIECLETASLYFLGTPFWHGIRDKGDTRMACTLSWPADEMHEVSLGEYIYWYRCTHRKKPYKLCLNFCTKHVHCLPRI